jgi:hypothetical protein
MLISSRVKIYLRFLINLIGIDIHKKNSIKNLIKRIIIILILRLLRNLRNIFLVFLQRIFKIFKSYLRRHMIFHFKIVFWILQQIFRSFIIILRLFWLLFALIFIIHFLTLFWVFTFFIIADWFFLFWVYLFLKFHYT